MNLRVKVPANSLLRPRLIVELGSSLLFRIADDIGHRLQISGLRYNPFVYELLRILREAQEKFAIRLQLIYRLDGLVNLVVETLNLLLTRRRQQEIVHLRLQRVVDLDVDVVARRLLRFRAFDTDNVIDDDWIWRMQKRIQPLRYFGELHSGTSEYLLEILVAVDELSLVAVLELVGLDVLPQSRDDDRPSLSVNAQ